MRIMKWIIYIMCCFIFIIFISYNILYNRWDNIWHRCKPMPYYENSKNLDDTIRIGFIGDSWAYLHHVCLIDTFLETQLRKNINKPIKVVSKGENGEITREIYKNMFKDDNNGTKSIIRSGLDYCIISAGINDAGGNLGEEQYCYHYRLIIDFLHHNKISPIIIEIPDACIWNARENKPLKEIAIDYIRSFMTKSPMYNCSSYRNALYSMLVSDKNMQQIIYIPLSEWNGNEKTIKKELCLSDQIHLNILGYEKLDSCIVRKILDKRENQ